MLIIYLLTFLPIIKKDNFNEILRDVEQDYNDKDFDSFEKLYTDSKGSLFSTCTKFTKVLICCIKII